MNEASERIASSSQTRWYAIRTLPRQDMLAESHLRRQNIHVFIPRILKNVRHARKIETRKAQLFPGYGFVELNLARQRWRSVNGTIGVAHLIMARELPMPVPTGIVEEFLAYSDHDSVVDLSRGLTVGSEVRLRAGPFAGAAGLLTGLDGKGRVEVLLRMMNRQIQVRTTQESLQSAGFR